MIAIGLRFPAGRYHATPWGRHVNEGAPEWPPSPWRLLRALVATWKSKAPELDEVNVRCVLEQLATPPIFHLPPATTGHSRHYMRWYKKGPEDQTLVFDAFVCLNRDSEVIAAWPDATLKYNALEVLSTLLENVGYLGRAESWCEARLLDSVTDEPNAQPLNAQIVNAGRELVRVLCADPIQAFKDEHVRPTSGKKGRGKNKRPPYDPPWHLSIETAQLHDEKWSDPPGSRWVQYVRRSDCFDPPRKLRSRPRRQRSQPQVVRFALDSTVLPLVTETLPVAEAARRALMSWHGRLTERNGVRGRSDTLCGKNAAGEAIRGHTHAYYLPTDEDGDGRVDHLTIVAHAGFGADEMRAMDRLREIRPRDRDNASHPLRVLLLGYGTVGDYEPPPLKPSCVWVSATPYIATRYAKTRGRQRIDVRSPQDRADFLIADLRDQIRLAVPEFEGNADDVEISPVRDGDVFLVLKRWRPIQFKRYRSKSGDDGGRRLAGAFRIKFNELTKGPILLGHSAHFGMGLFMPDDSDATDS